jgi:hypothetical protein
MVAKKYSSKSKKGFSVFDSTTLLMDLFVNCLESNNRASVGKNGKWLNECDVVK